MIYDLEVCFRGGYEEESSHVESVCVCVCVCARKIWSVVSGRAQRLITLPYVHRLIASYSMEARSMRLSSDNKTVSVE
jgi:hypothetical protein